jgi:hypothetical protein
MSNNQQVERILDGLTGDFKVGQRYYVFTVTYAYIGTVERVTDFGVHLADTWIVSEAGSDADAVTKIVHGKAKPSVYEKLGAPMFFARQAVTAAIEMQA